VDWAVVSAVARAAALRPMQQLRRTLLTRGYITTAALFVALTAIWSLVIRQLRRP